MKSFRTVVLALLMMFVFLGVSYSQEIGLPGDFVIKVKSIGEGDDVVRAIENFSGTTSDTTTDPENFCHDSIPQNTFKWGSDIAFNVFWQDTAMATVAKYETVVGVKSPSGETMLFCDSMSEYSGLTPGQAYAFCFACIIGTNTGGPMVTVDWGASVGNDMGVQKGKLGTITIQ